jgi:hypothetical protein
VPPSIAAGQHVTVVELGGDRPQAGRAAGVEVGNHRREITGMPVRVGRHDRPEGHSALPARLSAAAPLGLPSRTPRPLATASASLVRLEIASRSTWATSAMMPTVRLSMEALPQSLSLWQNGTG